MTSLLKITTTTLFVLGVPACLEPIDPINDSAESGVADSGMVDPTDGLQPGTYFVCYNDSNYMVNSAGQSVDFDLMHTCVSLEDPLNWMSDENMQKVLEGCSQTCQKTIGGQNNKCEIAGWKGAEPVNPDVLNSTCDPNEYFHDLGGDILWLDGVQSPKRQLKCDLKGTCGDLFGVEIADKLKGEVRSPDDRESSGAEQAADLQLQVTYGKASALQLEGHIEFSTLDCGEEACPIYLGDVDLSQAQASWPVLLDLGAFGRIDKQVSNVHARLARPALGIALEDGQIAFPAEALLFRVEVDVAGATHLLLENGKQSFWMRNPEVVLGRLVDGSLELKMDLPTEFGGVQVKAYAER